MEVLMTATSFAAPVAGVGSFGTAGAAAPPGDGGATSAGFGVGGVFGFSACARLSRIPNDSTATHKNNMRFIGGQYGAKPPPSHALKSLSRLRGLAEILDIEGRRFGEIQFIR